MIYLFLAILSSTGVSLILKYGEKKQFNRYLITSANYFIAFSISLGLSYPVLKNSELCRFKLGNFIDLFSNLGCSLPLNYQQSILWALIVGIFAGILYFLGFISIQASLNEKGVGITGAFSKLGILIPMILSLIFWKEFPNYIQSIGILTAIASIFVINPVLEKKKTLSKVDFTLLSVFIFVGLAEFSNKLFQKYGGDYYKSIFLFVVFFVAFFISIFFAWKKARSKLQLKAIFLGLLAGIPNLFASYFLIKSFDYFKTTIAFPIYCTGSILLMSLAGFFIYREKMKTREIFAVVLIVIGIIFMNIK